MQSLHYHIGNWRAEAMLEQLGTGKLMAVISLWNGNGGPARSQHTVVFDHAEGEDAQAETEALVRRLLRERYGI